MNANDIKKMMEAYLEVVSEKKLDPVNDKENDKKFKDRKDKDIDNDGDVDSSDEYLHKKRAATDDAIDGGDKPADNAKDDSKPVDKDKEDDNKKKKKAAGNSGEKTAEISKIGEKATTKEDVDQLLSALEEAAKPVAKPAEGEKIDDKESPKSKEFKAKHKVQSHDHDDMEKIEEPKERSVKKEETDTRTYQQKIMDILAGKTWGEVQDSIDELKSTKE